MPQQLILSNSNLLNFVICINSLLTKDQSILYYIDHVTYHGMPHSQFVYTSIIK